MQSYRTATIPFATSRWQICLAVRPKGVGALCTEAVDGEVFRFRGGSGRASSSSESSTSMKYTGLARRVLSLELILAEKERPAKHARKTGGLK